MGKKKRSKWKMTKAYRQKKYGPTYAAAKRRQRAVKVRPGQVRHHVGSKVTVVSRAEHARIHKRNGTAGGRPRKNKSAKKK